MVSKEISLRSDGYQTNNISFNKLEKSIVNGVGSSTKNENNESFFRHVNLKFEYEFFFWKDRLYQSCSKRTVPKKKKGSFFERS